MKIKLIIGKSVNNKVCVLIDNSIMTSTINPFLNSKNAPIKSSVYYSVSSSLWIFIDSLIRWEITL